MVKSAQNPAFLYSLVSGVQDTCGQGRVQEVFQRDFLAQSGNQVCEHQAVSP